MTKNRWIELAWRALALMFSADLIALSDAEGWYRLARFPAAGLAAAAWLMADHYRRQANAFSAERPTE